MTVTRRQVLRFLGSSLAAPALLRTAAVEAATPQLVKLGPLRKLDGAALSFDFGVPILAALPAGGFAAAWTRSGDFLPFSTRLRYYHVDGSANGGQLVLTLSNGWGIPIANADGTALVVHAKGTVTGTRIAAQKISATHAKNGAPLLLSTYGGGAGRIPIAVRLKNGNIAAAWSTGPGGDVRGRVVSKLGVGVSPDASIFGSTNDDEPVGIAALAGGGYVVGLRVQISSNSSTQFRVQILSAAGAKVGSPILLKAFPAHFPRYDRIGLGGLANGGFVAVWVDDVGLNRVLRGRFFSATGTPGATFTVPHFKKHDELSVNPKVIVRANGQIVVFAQAAVSYSFGYNDSVVAHLLSATGAELGTPLQVDITTTEGVPATDLIAQKDGTLVAAWSRTDTATFHKQCFVQRLRVA